ncbi:MAG TPA: HD domain-containing protein [Cyclobacteriaceae bacterium]|nr:HD domain-containing protein [Cyclobacteriaceae bacterium]
MFKIKIINDPVHGFIDIPGGIIFDLISHPWFQRLRWIKQLGLTDLVYPGALHTRFQHAIGAMHLMKEALQGLLLKGVRITDEEFEAAMAAILLHDIGHGPFSHALEHDLLEKADHEDISRLVIEKLNTEFKGKLKLALSIFNHTHPKRYLSQLVSSQLDVDRLDYLSRDSFFTGVNEGKIGTDRILKMLNVVDGELVVEEKAIYSIENFLSARRLMYWQVYLHKTTIGVEQMLAQIIRRAKDLARRGKLETSNKNIEGFLKREISVDEFKKDESLFNSFLQLDDHDIWSIIKEWRYAADPVLRELSNMMLGRKLFNVTLSNSPITYPVVHKILRLISEAYHIGRKEAGFLVAEGVSSNAAYIAKGTSIHVLMKSGKILDIAEAVDLPNIKAMSKIVKKYYLCWPKSVSL